MRPQARSLLHLVFLALALVLVTGTSARADDRTEARTHYQAGVKFYSSNDYRAAIREFSAAQQLAPADLNNYNLALCYDKLGDAEPAVQYYRAYLDKVPNSDKRAEIEASIARLDAAAKSAAAKKADEARKADDLRRAAEAKRAAEDARAAEEARKAEAKRRPVIEDKPPVEEPGVGVSGGVGPGASTTGTPGTGMTATTGDAQLDRVQQIDINQIRDQRVGGAASGMAADPRGGPSAGVGVGATASAGGPGVPPTPGAAAAAGPIANTGTAPTDQPKKADPVYKKWWFWAVVAVSAYVVYSIATDNSSNTPTRAREMPLGNMAAAPQPGGLTLMHW